MKKLIKAGATDQTIDIFVQDSSSTTGAGLTGLAYNTASLVCYYRKGAAGSATALTLATQTVGGAHSDGGFVEISSANMPGMYRLDLSDTIVDTAGTVILMLKGAANMAPLPIELQVGNVPADLMSILGTALTETAGLIAAGFKKFFNVATPTGTLNSLPDAVAGANGGLPTTNGTKLNQTADLTAGQSIACSDKTGFSLSVAGVQAIWDALTSALTTVGSIGKKLADWTIGTTQTADVNTLITTVGAAGAGLTALGDTRLANLDAAVSSRNATTPPTVTAIRQEMDANSTKLANLDATVGSRSTLAAGAAMTLTAAYDAAKTAAQAGDAMTLTVAERNAMADAHLDRADAIETGVTPRQAHRLEVAAAAGVTTGMATANPLIKNPAGSKTRVTATADADGNRTAITLTDLT